MDPEETNKFLQLIGKAVLKKIDSSASVTRVLNGEVPGNTENNGSSLNLEVTVESIVVVKEGEQVDDSVGKTMKEGRQFKVGDKVKDQTGRNADDAQQVQVQVQNQDLLKQQVRHQVPPKNEVQSRNQASVKSELQILVQSHQQVQNQEQSKFQEQKNGAINGDM